MPFSEETQKIFSKLKEKMQKTCDWISREISLIRGGRITPQLVSNLKVEAYGKEFFLKEIATLSLEGPRVVVIKPWDKSIVPSIEKSLYQSSLGGGVKSEGGKIFFSFQSLTQEEREKVLKIVNEKVEGGKRGLYKWRDEAWSKIQRLQRGKVISEDEKYRAKEELEEVFHQFLEKIEKLKEKKEKEILF